MVMVRCPSCSKNLNVPDKYAGKKAKCPACQGTLTIPVVLEEVVEEDFVEEVVPVKKRRPAPPRDADEDEEEEERIARKSARRARPIDDEDDDRPRRRKRRKITRSEWADCPNCGCSDATRVHWTFWGSWLGPLIINQVRCNECGTNYNGVHGDYNTTRIAIYIVINVALGLAIAAVAIVVGVAANQ
jgi:C4-type Zn-finger protein